MTLSKKLALCALAVLVAFAFGRWSAPQKIKTETKTVEVEKKTEQVHSDTDRDRHRETTITEVTKPDGTKEKTTKITEDSQVSKKTDKSDTDQVSKTQSQTKEVTYSASKVTVSALAGLSIASLSQPVYGASVTKPILGPITAGFWSTTPGVVGASLGLTF